MTIPEKRVDFGEPVRPGPQGLPPEQALSPVSAGLATDAYNLVWLIIRGKWIILAGVVLAVLYAGYSLTKFQPVYEARMIVAPIESGSGLRLPAGLGRIASQIGFPIEEKTASNFDRFRVLVGSVALATRLDRKYGYVKEVFAGSWDEARMVWIPPTGFRVDMENFFRRFFPIAEWQPPTVHNLAAYIKGSVATDYLEDNPLVYEIVIQHRDRDFALTLLARVYIEAEAFLRAQEVGRAQGQLEYVRDQLARTTVSDYRLSLIQVLAEQETKMMELQADLPLVGEVIEPPTVSDQPTKPAVIFYLILGVIAGLVFGIMLVLLINFLKTALAVD